LILINQLKLEGAWGISRYRGLSWLHYHLHWMWALWSSYCVLITSTMSRFVQPAPN